MDNAAASTSGTLAARLEKAANKLRDQANSIEETLRRINGTPSPQPESLPKEPGIAAIAPLVFSVERVENLAKKMQDLAGTLQGVA